MASVSKRTWKSSDKEKTAWVVRYADQRKKWHLKTFVRKKDADAWLEILWAGGERQAQRRVRPLANLGR